MSSAWRVMQKRQGSVASPGAFLYAQARIWDWAARRVGEKRVPLLD